MKIVSVFSIVSILLISILAVSCYDSGGGGEGEPSSQYDKSLWGEWVRWDPEETWYISSDRITVTAAGSSDSKKAALKKVSDQILEVQDGSQTYQLYASRIPNGKISGNLVMPDAAPGPSNSRAAANGIGSIKLVINNLNNPKDTQEAKIDEATGRFTAQDIIVGDEYELQMTDLAGNSLDYPSIAVIIQMLEEDLGNFAIGTDNSIKTFLKPAQDVDMSALYAGTLKVYDFTLEFMNTGVEEFPACVYSLNLGSTGLTIPKNRTGVLPSLPVGGRKTFPIQVSCSEITTASVPKPIEVIINVGNTIWKDRLELKFNREPLKFSIKSKAEIQGTLISPEAKAYPFKTTGSNDSYQTGLTVPWTDKPYLAVFSGAAEDTPYAVGINCFPGDSYKTFSDQNRYGANNTEKDAALISLAEMAQAEFLSYLTKGKAAYFTISTGAEPPKLSMSSRLVTTAQPAKTTYIQGDDLDLTGLTVRKQYNDGSSESVSINDIETSGFDKTKIGDQRITIKQKSDSTAASGTFTVKVEESTGTEQSITSFIIEGIPGVINEADKTIVVRMPPGTNLRDLKPVIVCPGASVSPASGTARNFTTSLSKPLGYTVTAKNKTTVKYFVTVEVGTAK